MPKPRNRATTKRNQKGGQLWGWVQNMQTATEVLDQFVGPGGIKQKVASAVLEQVIRRYV